MRRVLGMLQDWLAPDGNPPYPVTPFERLLPAFSDAGIPESGMGVDGFLDLVDSTVLPNTARLNHPKYIGHMTQALPWVSVAIEALTAAMNQNQVKIETAYVSTHVERQLIGWMHREVYGRQDAYYAGAMAAQDQALGNVVNGGTMGNLTALAIALERGLPGCRLDGLPAALERSGFRGAAVVASVRCHYSLKKSMATLGLGERALHAVPCDDEHRIDLQALEAKIAELRRDRIKVIAIVGIAGTTETGAIDPLARLAEIARREGAWFHVDGAWGGALLVSPQFRRYYEGIEQADSVVIDGHKLLWVPMAQSMVLVRDVDSLRLLRHHANYVLRNGSGDLGQTSLEGSRRFDAFKLWASFKIFGVSGYTTLLARAADVAQTLRELLREQPDFQLTSDSRTFILTYRYVPAPMARQLEAHLERGDLDAASALNARLSTLNAMLQERQKTGGASFVSRTVLESRNCPEGMTVLRVVLTNINTTREHLLEILAEQRGIGTVAARELGLAW